MADRPILFQGAMVRALLAGTKTQTRRAIKAPGPTGSGTFHIDTGFKGGHPVMVESIPTASGHEILWLRRCPYGQPGDRLWVRESWAYNPDLPGVASRACFMADPEHRHDGMKWKPSIHMPRSVCRIMLDVTGVRVERLQAITHADALAEGCEPSGWQPTFSDPDNATGAESLSARDEYAKLWESINGAASWDANPWVWVVEFKRVKPC